MDILYPKPLDKQIDWWPAVYDCISAVAAARFGYGRVYLSAGALTRSLYGCEDAAALSPDTYLRAVANLAEASRQTILADGVWPGLPEGQILSFAARLRRAGASLLLLEEVWTDHPGMIRALSQEGIAVAAVCKAEAAGGDVAALCRQARAEGARLTGAAGLFARDLRAFAQAVPGPKLLLPREEAAFPPVGELAAMGYTDAVLYFAEEGTQKALQIFGERTMVDQNTVYHDLHDFDGRLRGHDYHDIFDFGNYWLALEDTFYGRQKTDKE